MMEIEWHRADHFAALAAAVDVPADHIMAVAATGGDVVTVLYTTLDEPEFVYVSDVYEVGDTLTAGRRRFLGTVREVLELGSLAETIRRKFGEPS